MFYITDKANYPIKTPHESLHFLFMFEHFGHVPSRMIAWCNDLTTDITHVYHSYMYVIHMNIPPTLHNVIQLRDLHIRKLILGQIRQTRIIIKKCYYLFEP